MQSVCAHKVISVLEYGPTAYAGTHNVYDWCASSRGSRVYHEFYSGGKTETQFSVEHIGALPPKNGVQFEHLSIRAQAAAECTCNSKTGTLVACTSIDCILISRQWRFALTLSVMESEVSRPADADALVVNFEFHLNGIRYVTRSTERESKKKKERKRERERERKRERERDGKRERERERERRESCLL